MEIIRLTIVILGVQTTCGIPLLSGVERSKAASWEEIVEEAQSFHVASLVTPDGSTKDTSGVNDAHDTMTLTPPSPQRFPNKADSNCSTWSTNIANFPKTTFITSIIQYADTIITTSAEITEMTTAYAVSPINICDASLAGNDASGPQVPGKALMTLQTPERFLTATTRKHERKTGCFICARGVVGAAHLPTKTVFQSTLPQDIVGVTPAPNANAQEFESLTHDSQPSMNSASEVVWPIESNLKPLPSPTFTTITDWTGPTSQTLFLEPGKPTSVPSSCENTRTMTINVYLTTLITYINQDPQSLSTSFSDSIGFLKSIRVNTEDFCKGGMGLEGVQTPVQHLTTHTRIYHGCFPPNCKRDLALDIACSTQSSVPSGTTPAAINVIQTTPTSSATSITSQEPVTPVFPIPFEDIATPVTDLVAHGPSTMYKHKHGCFPPFCK